MRCGEGGGREERQTYAGVTSAISSTSTGASRGRTATPIALRACAPTGWVSRVRRPRAEEFARTVDDAGLAGEVRRAGDEADAPSRCAPRKKLPTRRAARPAHSTRRSGRRVRCLGRQPAGADLADLEELAVDRRELARRVDVVRRCAAPARRPRAARATAGNVRPSSAEPLLGRRQSGCSFDRPLQVGDQLLGVRRRARRRTSSQPSPPQLSRICLVACTSSGTVAYSHLVMAGA